MFPPSPRLQLITGREEDQQQQPAVAASAPVEYFNLGASTKVLLDDPRIVDRSITKADGGAIDISPALRVINGSSRASTFNPKKREEMELEPKYKWLDPKVLVVVVVVVVPI